MFSDYAGSGSVESFVPPAKEGWRRIFRGAALLLSVTLAAAAMAGVVSASPAAAATTPGPAPTSLTVGTLPDPVDVENLQNPLLGWNVGAGMQSAYEVQVATTPAGLGSPDVWDSGKVTSAKNSSVAYAGPALTATSGYFWRVRTWDATDNTSNWSAASHFGTGPGNNWAGATPIWTTGVVGLNASNVTYTGTFTISTVAASINFRETDTNNFYMWQFRTDGTLKEHKNVGGTFTVLNTVTLPVTPAAGTPYDFKIVTSGTSITTSIKPSSSSTWLSAGTMTDSTYASGALGFRTGSTEAFSVTNLSLTDTTGKVLYSNNFSDPTNTDFSACGTISNGARNVTSSKNCIYSGGGSANNNWALLRGNVSLPATSIQWAHLFVAASSTSPARQFVAKTSVNGTVIGVGPSRPVGSETRYDGYDVASLLNPGATNTISALAYTTSGQQYEALLVIKFTDGTSQTFGTGSGWKALNGSLALPDGGSIGTSYYTAPKENFQAAIFPFGYDKPAFDDSAWPAATTRSAFTNLVATPTAKVQQVLEAPTKVVEYSPGNYFIDYGRTWLGGLSLDLQGTAGQVVDIRYGEVTSGTNTVKYQTSAGNNYEDLWTLRSGDNPLQTWGPRVFRYVNVLNAPTGLTAANFTANAYVYPFDTSLSQFVSSNSNINSVWQLSKNTVEAVNLNGYVDSYERERGFYEADDYIQMMSNLSTGGDATLGTYSTLYLLSNRTWPTEWPFYVVLSLHDTYMATGDTTTIASAYTQLQSKLPDKWYDPTSGMIKKSTGNNCSSSTDCDIVDWPSGDRDGYQFSPFNTVVNSISYRAYADMADIATALGKTADASTYNSRAASIKAGLNSLMWNSAKGAYSDGSTDGATQIAHFAVQASAFAVAMGVATPDKASAAAAYLGTRGMACSVYCADFMVQAAFNGSNANVGAGFMASTAAYSWMSMIAQGAGATMEAWNTSDKSNLTYSHPWASSPASNIPQYMFGIQPLTAGYQTFQVKPQPSTAAPWAHITVPSPNGKIGAAYDAQSTRTDVAANVPANSTATVYVPNSAATTTVYVDGTAQTGTQNGGYLELDNVAPGCHVFTTDSSGAAYSDTNLTAICPAGYQKPQAITFAPLANTTVGSADIPVSASASSGLPVALAADGPCSITDGKVHITGAGDCTITASQPGDASNAAAQSVAQKFTVAKGSQAIAFPALPDHTYGDADFDAGATASSGLPVAYSTDGSCSVSADQVHMTGAGSCSVTAQQNGDENYTAADPVTQQFNIGKASQSITFAPLGDHAFGDADFAVGGTASSGLPVTYTVDGACTISDSEVHLAGAGGCAVTANQPGDDNYNAAAPVTQAFTVTKANQTIAFDPISDHTYGDPDFTVSASATSGLPVTFAASGGCTIAENRVHVAGAGPCTITAAQAGDANYTEADAVAQAFNVAQAAQVITFSPVADHTLGDSDFTVSATSSSGLPVSFTATGTCSVAGNIVHLTGAGTCSVSAGQSGDGNYTAATAVTQAFAIAKADQTISLAPVATHVLGDADFAVNGTASSGLPVSFVGTGACLVTGTTVHLTQAGICSLTASQPGDVNFNAAPSATGTFTVSPGLAVVSAPAASAAWGTAATITVKVTSTAAAVSGQVHLTEGTTDRGTAALNAGQAVFTLPVGLTAGSHTLLATYLGNANLATATGPVQVTVLLPTAWYKGTTYQAGATVSYNGQVYTAAWTTTAEQPGSNVYGAWQQIAITEDGKPLWTASRIFQAGDKVTYQGKVWLAGWYSRNDVPGSASGPWQEIATAPDGTAIWTPTRVFNAGDVALYNGQKYVAKWYSRNSVPTAANSAWTISK